MSFKAVIVLFILVSSAAGSALAHFSTTNGLVSANAIGASASNITASASKMLRNTVKKLEKPRYVRSARYEACYGGYGNAASHLPISERVMSCECLDKNIGGLDKKARQSVLDAVSTGRYVKPRYPSAVKVLKKCDIKEIPWTQMTIRGTQ